jgi:hypothetical protein
VRNTDVNSFGRGIENDGWTLYVESKGVRRVCAIDVAMFEGIARGT